MCFYRQLKQIRMCAKGQEMMYCKETAGPVVLHSLKAFLHRKIRAVVSASGNGPVASGLLR